MVFTTVIKNKKSVNGKLKKVLAAMTDTYVESPECTQLIERTYSCQLSPDYFCSYTGNADEFFYCSTQYH